MLRILGYKLSPHRFPPLLLGCPRVRGRTRLRWRRRRRRRLPPRRGDLRPGAGRDPGGKALGLLLLLVAQLLELPNFGELHRDGLVGLLGSLRSGLILSPNVGSERQRRSARGVYLSVLKVLTCSRPGRASLSPAGGFPGAAAARAA